MNPWANSAFRPFLAVGLALAMAGLGLGLTAGRAAPTAPNPPPGIPELPAGPQTQCTTTGPTWVLYGVHDPNGPARRGNRYAVTAWGLTCARARALLTRFFPKVPPRSTRVFTGGPKGYTCKGRASGSDKNREHNGTCLRRKHPPATFSWDPLLGKAG